MLHIHNGDSTAGTARESDIPGEHVAWREALVAGPTPAALSGDEWRELRARHLAAAYGLKAGECAADLLKQEEWLTRFRDHDEVVLWFEYDLFCQANLLYLLDWFSRRSLGQTRLSMVCTGEFPGIADFRGLGQLTAPQLSSLFPARREVTHVQLTTAARAWQAYSAATPAALESLLSEDTSALPFLRGALALHLARFPSAKNGLGRIEQRSLELVHAGVGEFGPLFRRFGSAEPGYGLGDAQFWNDLRRVARVPEPALAIENATAREDRQPAESFGTAFFRITEQGRRMLAGETDFVAANGVDFWLGGVHLQGKDVWRWDEGSNRIVNR